MIVPFVLDQSFWGARIKAMGVGPDPIQRKDLTSDRLARPLKMAVTDTQVNQRSGVIGAAIRAEDGAANAVKVIEQYLGAPGAGESEQKL